MSSLPLRSCWLLVVLAALVAYWGSQDAPFVYDDKIEVVGNRTIRFLEDVQAIAAYNLGRPLLIFSYAWNYDRFGMEPRGYHLTNGAIFALLLGAGLWMAERVGVLANKAGAVGLATAATLLFAVHPMGTEAVIYTTGRSETLCALFCLLSLGSWATALDQERAGRGGVGWRALGVLAFLAASLSKEVGAVVPGLWLAMELLLGPGEGLRGRLRGLRWGWLLPAFGALLLAGVVRIWSTGALLPAEADRGLGVQLSTQAFVWLRYLRLWLMPVGQTLFHHQPELSPLSAQGISAWIGLGLLGAGGVVVGRRSPAAGFALVGAALTLLPSSSFVQLKENMAEHRSFQAGFFLLLAIVWALPPLSRRLSWGLVAGAALLLGLATRQRVEVWSSEVALWTEATEHSPQVADAWYGLGDAYRFAGRFEEAAPAYRAALNLDPNHLDAWNNLGISRAELGDAKGAEEAWKGALRVKPSYCKGHNNLGGLAFNQREWERARSEFMSTLAYCPDSVVAHYMLGKIYDEALKDNERAQLHYEAVLQIDPHFSRAEEVRKRLLAITW
jgi:tetratricopeptide (TPR) repeat protein